MADLRTATATSASQVASANLEQAFALLAANDMRGAANIHDVVIAYVDAMKSDGLPVERVIVGIKQLAVRAGVHHRRALHIVPDATSASPLAEDLVGTSVRWCIERYYPDAMRPGSKHLQRS